MHTAQGTATAKPTLPTQRTLMIRVQTIHHAGFLSSHQHFPAIRTGHQHRRGTEIQILASIFRAIDATRQDATHVPGIVWRELARPHHPAIGEIQRKNRVTPGIGRLAVVLTSAHIESAARGIDRRRAPDGRARRSPATHKQGIAVPGLGNLGGIGLPQALSAGRIQRQHRAAKGAAAVERQSRQRHLIGGNRHIQAALMEHRSPGHRGGAMGIHRHLPDPLAGGGVQCLGMAEEIPEEQPALPARTRLPQGNGGAHLSAHKRFPTHAARLPTQSVDPAALAAHIDRVGRYCRLGARLVGEERETESPLQFQAGDIRRAQRLCADRGCAGVCRIETPTIGKDRRLRVKSDLLALANGGGLKIDPGIGDSPDTGQRKRHQEQFVAGFHP